MYDMYDKISYLRGLADGMEVSSDSAEGKLLIAMIEVLDEMVGAIDDNFEYTSQLEDYVVLMDDDLSDIEEDIYDIEYDDYSPIYENVECNCCNEEEYSEED